MNSASRQILLISLVMGLAHSAGAQRDAPHEPRADPSESDCWKSGKKRRKNEGYGDFGDMSPAAAKRTRLGIRKRKAVRYSKWRKSNMRLIMIFLIAIIMIPILVAIGTAIFQWLWNITMPDVFNLKEIRFWQAFRILLLANFLFGAGSFISFSMGIGG